VLFKGKRLKKLPSNDAIKSNLLQKINKKRIYYKIKDIFAFEIVNYVKYCNRKYHKRCPSKLNKLFADPYPNTFDNQPKQ